MFGSGKLVAGSRFVAWERLGNLTGSLIKKISLAIQSVTALEFSQILRCVTNRIQKRPVQVSLLGVELEGRPFCVSNCVWVASFPGDCRESSEEPSLLIDASLVKELGIGVLLEVRGSKLEFAKGAHSFGVNISVNNTQADG